MCLLVSAIVALNICYYNYNCNSSIRTIKGGFVLEFELVLSRVLSLPKIANGLSNVHHGIHYSVKIISWLHILKRELASTMTHCHKHYTLSNNENISINLECKFYNTQRLFAKFSYNLTEPTASHVTFDEFRSQLLHEQ